MARRCVCQLCKKNGDTDTFYKVVNDKGTTKYYCNKDEYDNFQKQKETRHDLMVYIAEQVLEYEDGQIVPPVMVKRIEELNKFYGYEVIQECFVESKEDIQYWMNVKNFSNEYGMASYIIKIIENKINDTYKKWKFKQRQEQIQQNHTVDLGIINEINDKSIHKANDGIMEFLDGDDL